MNTLSFSTHFATKEEAQKEWVVVDATDQVVGRLASKVAKILRGKYKPCFTPNQDCGDNVIIINADKIQFTGAKWTDKQYLTYSGYPSGQHKINPENLAKKPHGYERILRHAVKGMLPKGRLGSKILKNLYIYEGAEHEQQAQSPKSIDINALK
ncbi:MAG: 50S ribosomal protein L13 [Bacteroidaceae bacterium]|nr:50S ribosomal protein L13 [Bacteroidaceae bacterium]MBR3531606.1 50S ribosomal protein L13 [Bacteroidaceae bacterium]